MSVADIIRGWKNPQCPSVNETGIGAAMIELPGAMLQRIDGGATLAAAYTPSVAPPDHQHAPPQLAHIDIVS